jgi:hypothetical protein
LTPAGAVTTSHLMLSRTTHFLASILAAAAFSSCSSTYSDVYSFKKNSFIAPPAPKTEIAPPPPTTDPFAAQPGQVAPGGAPAPGIPGIPGLDAPAPAPAPGTEAVPGTTPPPAPVPGAAPIPGL